MREPLAAPGLSISNTDSGAARRPIFFPDELHPKKVFLTGEEPVAEDVR
jgi:hypothetical protein